MQKVAVFGADGMLGSDTVPALTAAGFQVASYVYPQFNFTDPQMVAAAVADADLIVNCAAYTAVDRAESESQACAAVNTAAVGELGRQVAAAGKYVLHISTDFVFGDLSQQPQSENAVTNPLSVYGRTKLGGEVALKKSGCRHAVIRVQWTYGAHGNNFIAKIVEKARSGAPLNVVDDQVGAPTPNELVAKVIAALVGKRQEGLFHLAAAGFASRFEVAAFILKQLNLQNPLTPAKTGDFITPAKRPLNSRFNCAKIETVLDFSRPSWEEALKAYLAVYPEGRKF